jgi:hypothetical protein
MINRTLHAMACVVGLALALPTQAAVPPGWTIAGTAPADYDVSVDNSTAPNGKRSALIIAKPGAKSDGFGTLMQVVAADDYRGARLKLSGYLRTESVNRAQMWMRVDGANGKAVAFDNMDSRPVTGTTGWMRYDIVLDVPPDSVDIAFGFLLISRGKVWGNDFRFDKVGATVPVTVSGPPLPRAPANLDFEESDSAPLAVWMQRKLTFFDPPRDAGGIDNSCDRMEDRLKFVLLRLGARASDIHVDARPCHSYGPVRSLDATFWVLVPVNKSGTGAADVVDARWQLAQLSGGDLWTGSCTYLDYAARSSSRYFQPEMPS